MRSMLTSQKLSLAVSLFLVLLSSEFEVVMAKHTPDQVSEEVVALNNRAVAEIQGNRYEEAIDLLKQAIVLQPDLAAIHFNLGCIYEMRKEYGPAIEALKQTLFLSPTFTDAQHHLGTSYIKTGRFEEAVECFQRALQLKPDRADSLTE